MRQRTRLAIGMGLVTATALAALTGAGRVGVEPAAAASTVPNANSHWTSCNDNAVSSAPKIVWTRIKQATTSHKDIPQTFWTNSGYRGDIVKIVCYESSYYWHASNAGQYGWYQMSQSLISSEGVSWSQYWKGSSTHAAGWYQCVAGERYIKNRYGTPGAAWQHEKNYGWY